MTPIEREKLLALALDLDTRANSAYKKRGHGEYYSGQADAYDYAGDELRALVEELT